MYQLFFVEVEVRGLPVVQQRHTRLKAVLQLILTGPIVEIAAGLSLTFPTISEIEIGRTEHFLRLQGIGGSIRIDARHHTQRLLLVHLKSEAEITGPSQGSDQHFTAVFGGRLVQSQLEERRTEHIGTGAQFRIEHLLAKHERRFLDLYFTGPIAGKFGQEITLAVQVQQGRGILVQHHGLLLLMTDFGKRPDDIHRVVSDVMQVDCQRIDFIAQGDHHFLHTRFGLPLGVRDILQQRRGVAVGMHHMDSRFKIVLHAVREVGFLAGWQMVQVGGMVQRLSQIVLIDTSILTDPVNQIDVGCTDTDRRLLDGMCGPGKSQQSHEEHN
ncbi:hypothetical protein EVA_15651 [gut metagenome]|uniref:Uncharacterized protein n=1 Tax=gut metagenome TaxID=749906 RepID=J9C8K8_9ZZZZ